MRHRWIQSPANKWASAAILIRICIVRWLDFVSAVLNTGFCSPKMWLYCSAGLKRHTHIETFQKHSGNNGPILWYDGLSFNYWSKGKIPFQVHLSSFIRLIRSSLNTLLNWKHFIYNVVFAGIYIYFISIRIRKPSSLLLPSLRPSINQ